MMGRSIEARRMRGRVHFARATPVFSANAFATYFPGSLQRAIMRPECSRLGLDLSMVSMGHPIIFSWKTTAAGRQDEHAPMNSSWSSERPLKNIWRARVLLLGQLGKRRSNHFLLSRQPSAYFLFTSRAVVRYFPSSRRPFPIVRLVRGPIQHISRRYARDGRNFSLTIYKLLKANSTLICESFLAKPL